MHFSQNVFFCDALFVCQWHPAQSCGSEVAVSGKVSDSLGWIAATCTNVKSILFGLGQSEIKQFIRVYNSYFLKKPYF